MKTLIVIPTYNEKENIENLIRSVFALNITDLEIIVVDDNSPDNTSQIVTNLKSTFTNLNLITRPNKLGLGSAYITGFKKALEHGADYIIQMDADFSHSPKDILELLTKANDFDVVIGSRKIAGGSISGWNYQRKFMSAGAAFFTRLFLNLNIKDVTSGFRCFKRQVLQTIPLDKIGSTGYAFQEEILYRAGQLHFSCVEVPITFVNRKNGYSKLNSKEIWQFLITIIKLKFGLR